MLKSTQLLSFVLCTSERISQVIARAVFERLNFGYFYDNTASFKSESRHKKAFANKCQHCSPFSVLQMFHATLDQLKRGQSAQDLHQKQILGSSAVRKSRIQKSSTE